MIVGRAAILVLGMSLGFGSPAVAGPFDPFTGSFAASGTVVEGPGANTHQVRCSFTSAQDGSTSFALHGTCWAYLILSRAVSADLLVNPRSGKVSGTYSGARVGPAAISGARMPAGFDLTIMWPKPVFGNMTSNLQIASLAKDRFRILVLSRIGQNGPVRPITDLVLVRQ